MKNNKGLIIGIIGLIIVMIGGTYAYYRWNSTSNINVSVKVPVTLLPPTKVTVLPDILTLTLILEVLFHL